jgi:putative ABC transport system substrate-binding protein
MNRRGFIALLGGAAAAWPLAARAQQPARRIGMLIGYSEIDPEIQARLVAFRQALEGNGWKEGRSVLIDYARWGRGIGQVAGLPMGSFDARGAM